MTPDWVPGFEQRFLSPEYAQRRIDYFDPLRDALTARQLAAAARGLKLDEVDRRLGRLLDAIVDLARAQISATDAAGRPQTQPAPQDPAI